MHKSNIHNLLYNQIFLKKIIYFRHIVKDKLKNIGKYWKILENIGKNIKIFRKFNNLICWFPNIYFL